MLVKFSAFSSWLEGLSSSLLRRAVKHLPCQAGVHGLLLPLHLPVLGRPAASHGGLAGGAIQYGGHGECIHFYIVIHLNICIFTIDKFIFESAQQQNFRFLRLINCTKVYTCTVETGASIALVEVWTPKAIWKKIKIIIP